PTDGGRRERGSAGRRRRLVIVRLVIVQLPAALDIAARPRGDARAPSGTPGTPGEPSLPAPRARSRCCRSFPSKGGRSAILAAAPCATARTASTARSCGRGARARSPASSWQASIRSFGRPSDVFECRRVRLRDVFVLEVGGDDVRRRAFEANLSPIEPETLGGE